MIDVDAIRAAAPLPLEFARRLGLKCGPNSKPHHAWAICPWHIERNPSCSITVRDGRLAVHCFSCGASSDDIGLVAAVHNLDTRRDFRRAAELTAALVGASMAPHTAGRHGPASRDTAPTPMPRPINLDALADVLVPLDAEPDVAAYLASRGLLVQARAAGLRALDVTELQYQIDERIALDGDPTDGELGHAGLVAKRGDTYRVEWQAYRLAIPWRDAAGNVTVIQRRVLDDRRPKYTTHGRVVAPFGVDRLEPGQPIAIVEGALDALAWTMLDTEGRVALGIPGTSGWRSEWASVARGRVVHVATDADDAGDKAAKKIGEDCHRAGAARVVRVRSLAGDWADQARKAVS